MIIYNINDEVVDEGKRHNFTYEGQDYTGYVRIYGDGSRDVEVYLTEDRDAEFDPYVYDYAWDLFESLGILFD